MNTCEKCHRRTQCIEICLLVKKLIPAVEDGRNSDREVLMAPADLALAADIYSLSEWNQSSTRQNHPKLDLDALSVSERQALAFIAEGLSFFEAAKALGVSRSTVQSYMARARKKLAIQNRHIVRKQKSGQGRRQP